MKAATQNSLCPSCVVYFVQRFVIKIIFILVKPNLVSILDIHDYFVRLY